MGFAYSTVCTLVKMLIIVNYPLSGVGLAWRSGSVMDCHATARGSIPGWNGVKTELHVLHKGR